MNLVYKQKIYRPTAKLKFYDTYNTFAEEHNHPDSVWEIGLETHPIYSTFPEFKNAVYSTRDDYDNRYVILAEGKHESFNIDLAIVQCIQNRVKFITCKEDLELCQI